MPAWSSAYGQFGGSPWPSRRRPLSESPAKRTTGATAGLLAVDESSKDVARSSCVLILQRSAAVYGCRALQRRSQGAGRSRRTDYRHDHHRSDRPGGQGRAWAWPARMAQRGTDRDRAGGRSGGETLGERQPGPELLEAGRACRALLRELVNRGKAVASQLAEPRRQEIKTRLDEVEKRRAELRGSLESLRQRASTAEMNGVRGFAADPIAEQRRQLEFELATKRPRLQAIKEILPRVTAQSDEIGDALRGLVAARKALIVGLEKAVGQGKGDPVELLRVRADLAEARVRLAEWGTSGLMKTRDSYGYLGLQDSRNLLRCCHRGKESLVSDGAARDGTLRQRRLEDPRVSQPPAGACTSFREQPRSLEGEVPDAAGAN